MAISCDTNDLAKAAKCFKCLSPATLLEVQVYLLCQLVNNGTGGGGAVPALPDSQIFVGNASNVATAVAMSKDATIADTGAVTLANNATARSDIGLGTTDIAVFQAVRELQVAIAASDIDWSLGGIFTKAIAAATVFTFSNTTAGRVIKVVVVGDASHTVTWPVVSWAGGVPPVQTLSKTDVYTFICMASGTIFGSAVQNMS